MIRHSKENGPIENLIFITLPDDPFFYAGGEEEFNKAKNRLMLQFDDIEYEITNCVAPTKEHVQQALDFSEGKDDIIVSCNAGISRSAATAFLIACKKYGMDKAFEILNPKLHCPNALIIRHGSEILNIPDLPDKMNAWNMESMPDTTDLF